VQQSSQAALLRRRKNKLKLTGFIWIAPAVVLSVIFRYYPFFNGFFLSLQEWDGVNAPIFIGLRNYIELFRADPGFWQAFRNNVIYAAGTVTGKILLSLFIAVLINQRLPGMTTMRTILFTPVVMSFVVVGLLWGWILDYNFGLVNSAMRSMGLGAYVQDWLGDPKIALGTLIFVDIWKWYGFHMVIFLAALQSISRDLYEAASIDGATANQSFWRITLPLLGPVLAVNIAISLMGGFNVFDLVFVLTEGGPFNSTNVVSLYMYIRGFKYYRMGYATAMSYLLFVLVIAATLIQLKLTGSDQTK